jgi:hypothetical protein
MKTENLSLVAPVFTNHQIAQQVARINQNMLELVQLVRDYQHPLGPALLGLTLEQIEAIAKAPRHTVNTIATSGIPMFSFSIKDVRAYQSLANNGGEAAMLSALAARIGVPA